MRVVRKRFTTPKTRSNATRQRAVKSVEGVAKFRQSDAGRALRAEKLADQWQLQSGICPQCGDRISLSDARFSLTKFSLNETNLVIHKRCKTTLSGEIHA